MVCKDIMDKCKQSIEENPTKKTGQIELSVEIPQAFVIEPQLLHFEDSPRLESLLLLFDICNSK